LCCFSTSVCCKHIFRYRLTLKTFGYTPVFAATLHIWEPSPPLYLNIDADLGPTQPPIQWVPGALSLGVKWPGREADHSPPSSVGVKNARSYTSISQYAFMAWCLVKHRDNFTFTFYLYRRGQDSNGYRWTFLPGVKWPGREAATHLRLVLPRSYTSTPPIRIYCLDNYFYLTGPNFLWPVICPPLLNTHTTKIPDPCCNSEAGEEWSLSHVKFRYSLDRHVATRCCCTLIAQCCSLLTKDPIILLMTVSVLNGRLDITRHLRRLSYYHYHSHRLQGHKISQLQKMITLCTHQLHYKHKYNKDERLV
jgi:hypothetical protein